MQLLSEAASFFSSYDFWWWHGWGLTGCWLITSFIAILLKKLVSGMLGAILHGLLFFINNALTLFLAAGAFYRVYPNLSKFNEWSLLKQSHIFAGILFTIFVVLQHLGGMGLLMTGKSGPNHRKFGMFISTVMRFIAVFGWLLIREEKLAGICGVIALLETVILLSINRRGGPAKITDKLAKYAQKPKRY
jgi:hypothetical protein